MGDGARLGAHAWLLVLYERRAELKRARQDDLNADL
jgi:hypothetical protein